MKIAIVGNCHIHQIAEALEFVLAEKVETLRDPLSLKNSIEKLNLAKELLNSMDVIGVVSSFYDDMVSIFPENTDKFKMIPHVRASAFAPDIVEVYRSGKRLETCMEVSHSRLVLYGYLRGLGKEDVKALFNEKVFRTLSYFDEWGNDIKWASYQSHLTGWDVENLYKKWRNSGCFSHTPNHPKLMVLADLAIEFAIRNNLNIKFGNPRDILVDRAASHAIWPVYPEIAKLFNIYGAYLFKPNTKGRDIFKNKSFSLSLDDFINSCYESYASYSLSYADLDSALLSDFEKIDGLRAKVNSSKLNPYSNLESYHFWKRSISSIRSVEVDPVVAAKFKIGRRDRVATAGSCFAQHIAKTLSKKGFNYYVSEVAPEGLSAEEAAAQNYGVFSARYGNLYTTTQLLQLFKRAYGYFSPNVSAMLREDGKLIDPFRPYITPEGFNDSTELLSSLEEHFCAVREMFENLDVFVFTLGLTEGWKNTADGSVYPIAPGVFASDTPIESYEFFNMSSDEVIADIEDFRSLLKQVNPKAKMILTVSPVPLIATYEPRHVLVATTYSKSVLRVAADVLAQKFEDVMYFPSYEIITGNFSKGQYYADDLREVTPSGVEHVMKLFVKHCVEHDNSDFSSLEKQIANSKVVCDEEKIDE